MGEAPARRLVFGSYAEDYDRFRPGYPDALFADLRELTAATGPATRALEAGAGTGKASVGAARAGFDVLAVEPDPRMAELGGRRCAGLPVRYQVAELEDCDPPAGWFDLVFAAQSWHWVRPAEGATVARRALRAGGVLAVFWNRVDADRFELSAPLAQVYTERAPELGPPRPAGCTGTERDEEPEWRGLFEAPEWREYRRSWELSTEEFVGLTASHSDHRLLAPDRLAGLLAGVRELLDRAGGRVRLPICTDLQWARATG